MGTQMSQLQDKYPKTVRLYIVVWRGHEHTHPWMIVGRTGDGFDYYEFESDAWEFCQAMARKACGMAILLNMAGQVAKEVDYVKDTSEPGPLATGKLDDGRIG